MKFPTLLLTLALFCAAQPAIGAEESFQGTLQRGSAPHPSLYSFSDLYRLALSGPAGALSVVPASDAPIRIAAGQPAPQFAISDMPEPQQGALLLAGLALALWVARRRLGYGF
jgi:MYXO-CTERM domain-containing protein